MEKKIDLKETATAPGKLQTEVFQSLSLLLSTRDFAKIMPRVRDIHSVIALYVTFLLFFSLPLFSFFFL